MFSIAADAGEEGDLAAAFCSTCISTGRSLQLAGVEPGLQSCRARRLPAVGSPRCFRVPHVGVRQEQVEEPFLHTLDGWISTWRRCSA